MVSTRSTISSSESFCLISPKVASDIASSRTISRAPRRMTFASGSSFEGLPSVSAINPWISSSVTPNSLPIFTWWGNSYSDFSIQPTWRIELVVEADVAADAVEGAGHVGRVHQQLVQIGVALEHVAVFGGDLVGFEIGQAGHFVVVLVGDSGSGSFSHRALCAPARSWRRNLCWWP